MLAKLSLRRSGGESGGSGDVGAGCLSSTEGGERSLGRDEKGCCWRSGRRCSRLEGRGAGRRCAGSESQRGGGKVLSSRVSVAVVVGLGLDGLLEVGRGSCSVSGEGWGGMEYMDVGDGGAGRIRRLRGLLGMESGAGVSEDVVWRDCIGAVCMKVSKFVVVGIYSVLLMGPSGYTTAADGWAVANACGVGRFGVLAVTLSERRGSVLALDTSFAVRKGRKEGAFLDFGHIKDLLDSFLDWLSWLIRSGSKVIRRCWVVSTSVRAEGARIGTTASLWVSDSDDVTSSRAWRRGLECSNLADCFGCFDSSLCMPRRSLPELLGAGRGSDDGLGDGAATSSVSNSSSFPKLGGSNNFSAGILFRPKRVSSDSGAPVFL